MPWRGRPNLAWFAVFLTALPIFVFAKEHKSSDSQTTVVGQIVGDRKVDTVKQFLTPIGRAQGFVTEKYDKQKRLMERVTVFSGKTVVEIDRNGDGFLDEWELFSERAHVRLTGPTKDHWLKNMDADVLTASSRIHMHLQRRADGRFELLHRDSEALRVLFSELRDGRGLAAHGELASENKSALLTKAQVNSAVDSTLHDQNRCTEGAFRSRGHVDELSKIKSAVANVLTSDASPSASGYLGCLRQHQMDTTASFIQAQFQNPARIAGDNRPSAWAMGCQTCEADDSSPACAGGNHNGAFIPAAINKETAEDSVLFVASSSCSKNSSCGGSQATYARTFTHEMLHKAFIASESQVNSILDCCAPADGAQADCQGLSKTSPTVRVSSRGPSSGGAVRSADVATSGSAGSSGSAAGSSVARTANVATRAAVSSAPKSATASAAGGATSPAAGAASGQNKLATFLTTSQTTAVEKICTTLFAGGKSVGDCLTDYMANLEGNCDKVNPKGCQALSSTEMGTVETKTLDNLTQHDCHADKEACQIGKEELAQVLAPDSKLAKEKIDFDKLTDDKWLKGTEKSLDSGSKMNYHDLSQSALGGAGPSSAAGGLGKNAGPTARVGDTLGAGNGAGNGSVNGTASTSGSGLGQHAWASRQAANQNSFSNAVSQTLTEVNTLAEVQEQSILAPRQAAAAAAAPASVSDPTAASVRPAVMNSTAPELAESSGSITKAKPGLDPRDAADSSAAERGKNTDVAPVNPNRAPSSVGAKGLSKTRIANAGKIDPNLSSAAKAVRDKAKKNDPRARGNFIKQMTLLERDEIPIALADDEVQNSLQAYVLGAIDESGQRRDRADSPLDWLIYNHRTTHLVYKKGQAEK